MPFTFKILLFVIINQLMKCNFNYQEPSPWSVVALLSLVCKTVQEIQAIVYCLSQSTSCLIHDILECFYCLASVYYYLESQHRIGSGYVEYIKSCIYVLYTLKPVLTRWMINELGSVHFWAFIQGLVPSKLTGCVDGFSHLV